MRHRKKTVILDRRAGPRARLLRGLAVDALLRERIRTTEARARAIRPLVERAITTGKESTLVRRRKLLAVLIDRRAVAKVLEVLGPRYRDRAGGYTRTTKVGPRLGDGAKMVVFELV